MNHVPSGARLIMDREAFDQGLYRQPYTGGDLDAYQQGVNTREWNERVEPERYGRADPTTAEASSSLNWPSGSAPGSGHGGGAGGAALGLIALGVAVAAMAAAVPAFVMAFPAAALLMLFTWAIPPHERPAYGLCWGTAFVGSFAWIALSALAGIGAYWWATRHPGAGFAQDAVRTAAALALGVGRAVEDMQSGTSVSLAALVRRLQAGWLTARTPQVLAAGTALLLVPGVVAFSFVVKRRLGRAYRGAAGAVAALGVTLLALLASTPAALWTCAELWQRADTSSLPGRLSGANALVLAAAALAAHVLAGGLVAGGLIGSAMRSLGRGAAVRAMMSFHWLHGLCFFALVAFYRAADPALDGLWRAASAFNAAQAGAALSSMELSHLEGLAALLSPGIVIALWRLRANGVARSGGTATWCLGAAALLFASASLLTAMLVTMAYFGRAGLPY